MFYSFLQQNTAEYSANDPDSGGPNFLILFITAFGIYILYKTFSFIEYLYAKRFRKPLVLNAILLKRKLTESQRQTLKYGSQFYNNLSKQQQSIFEHRLVKYISDKEFTGRGGLVITDEMKVLISAVIVELTFGMRHYLVPLFESIVVYPDTFFSKFNNANHKGETNPKLKTIVFSWKHFKEGMAIDDDNLNLGIHEFGHAIHLNAYATENITSVIFKKGFEDLINYLDANPELKKRLINSKYFRAYAYTNQFEFFAVLLENFIETPKEFKTQFPKLYNYMALALNYNIAV